jgi:PAS domain S-box-containing protein
VQRSGDGGEVNAAIRVVSRDDALAAVLAVPERTAIGWLQLRVPAGTPGGAATRSVMLADVLAEQLDPGELVVPRPNGLALVLRDVESRSHALSRCWGLAHRLALRTDDVLDVTVGCAMVVPGEPPAALWDLALAVPSGHGLSVIDGDLVESIHTAMRAGELVLHYQPIVDLRSGRITSLEALVRWDHPRLGLLAPAAFMPIVAELDLHLPLGDMVLRAAAAQAARWQAAGRVATRIFVNLDAAQLADPDRLTSWLGAVLLHAGVGAEWIGVEVTESTAISDLDAAVHGLRRCREMGVEVLLDDFGTGYSSLSYLRRLPIDGVKIDRSFVTEVPSSLPEAALVEGIVELAHTLGLRAIAEGIEQVDELETLAELGVDRAQGFLFSPARPAGEIERLLDRPWSGAEIVTAASRAGTDGVDGPTRHGVGLGGTVESLPGHGSARTRLLLASLDASPTPVMILDGRDRDRRRGHRVTYVNPAVVSSFGWTAESIVGQWSSDFLPDLSSPALRRLVDAMDAGVAIQVELDLSHDGQVVPCELSVSPVLDDGGTRTHWLATARDLRTERRIAAERDRLSWFIETTASAIVLWSRELGYFFANPAARTLLGIDSDDHLARLQPGDLMIDHDLARAGRAAVFETGRWSSPVEVRDQRTGEAIPVTMEMLLERNHPDHLTGSVMVVMRDRRAELAVRDAEQRVSQRLRAVFDHAPDSVLVLGPRGRIAFANRAARELFDLGSSADAPPFEIIHPDDRERVASLLQVLLADDIDMEAQRFRVWSQQAWVTVEAVSSAPVDEPGLSGIVVTLRLIDEQVAREEHAKRRAQLAELRADLGSRALTASDGIDDALPGAMTRLTEILGVDQAFVNRIDPERHMVTVLADSGPFATRAVGSVHHDWWRRLPSFMAALSTGTPMIASDLVADRPVWADEVETYFGAHFRAAVVISLRARGRLVGELGVAMGDSTRPWSDDEIAGLLAIGDVVALAMLASASIEGAQHGRLTDPPSAE